MAIQQIDLDKCVGCGVCENSCSMDVIRLNRVFADREEMTPCRSGCPAGVDMRGYIYHLTQGRMEEAVRLIRETLPFPAVTGHVCFHPCEEECARKEVDEAVNINSLERYIGDYWLQERTRPAPRLYFKKTAVIGSGPAGLAAAYDLVRIGYPVTVFESERVLGGMLSAGIPEYRLPGNVLDAQIGYIRDLGVDFRTGVALGEDLTLSDLREEEYEAVLLAIGARKSARLDIEGIEFTHVLWGLDFLRAVKFKRKVRVMDRVVVIGGGNVAVDAALTALRLGAKEVRIFCLESLEEMPAHEEAIRMALEEGVRISGSWGPKRLIGKDGIVTGMEMVRCLSVFDTTGRFNPTFGEETTRPIKTDMVIFAIGESTDLSVLPTGVETEKGHILVDPVTLQTRLPGIFAAGVAVYGPGSVIEAVASGKKAAVSIDRYLQGKDLKAGRQVEVKTVRKPPRDGVEKKKRESTVLLPPDERKRGFREIRIGFTRERAEREAQRCMACGSKAWIAYNGDCMTCYSCERDCPEKAVYVSPVPVPARIVGWG
jgi:NADPH-dependent glutamate synthase beta subunit-like oxidoreductase